ncbi:MAG: hypothetical protein F4149_05095 [Gammaproteobacteria bacterium]|nr:hypothetical protein [Gammaproteobacteria bacterium]MYK82825.1 hypothetical protein [Gammaproteobacteria bacterium]
MLRTVACRMKRPPISDAVQFTARGLVSILSVWLLFLTSSPVALANADRDIVFECPCEAEWLPTEADDVGELRLTFAVRNHRTTRSGEVRLVPIPYPDVGLEPAERDPAIWASVGNVAASTVSAARTESLRIARPASNRPIVIRMYERVGRRGSEFDDTLSEEQWMKTEDLALWPMSSMPDTDSFHFVDLLTDSDDDGVGDANEQIAGTLADDANSAPGVSTIDVLLLYDDPVLELFGGDPYTKMHHTMVVTRKLFEDSGTNIRLRAVGMTRFVPNTSGVPDDLDALEAQVGADITLRFVAPDSIWQCGAAPGCAPVGGAYGRGRWEDPRGTARIRIRSTSVDLAAHELGHLMGLAHSARQGSTHGAFLWSRGHYGMEPISNESILGTIMSYGSPDRAWDVFSDPDADCRNQPCGVASPRPDGADAVRSLDLMRFQIAARRSAMADSDGDGIVDPVDAVPDDPSDWRDKDNDGLGDNADPDDDNDNVPDMEDAFPLDPLEWADADGDGVGDNVDEEIADLGPFRDAALRQAVEKELGKEPGAPIDAADMAELTYLSGRYLGIRYLDGLELAENLGTLDLRGNSISDPSPLMQLQQLRGLELGANRNLDPSPLATLSALNTLSLPYNGMWDLSPLSSSDSIQYLKLQSNNIVDLSPLSSMEQIRELDLRRNGIKDLTPLAGLALLQILWLDWNDVRDFSPLARNKALRFLGLNGNSVIDLQSLPSLPKLGHLQLRHNGITDLSPLRRLAALEDLELAFNRIEDVAPLAELTELTSIDLSHNRISDPSPLTNPNLQILEVSHNPVALKDLAELPSFPNLQSLGLQGLGIEDLSPLAALRDPRSLYLDSNAIVDLSPLGTMSGFESLSLSNNQIVDIEPLADCSKWSDDYASLTLDDNPLSPESIDTHIPMLRSCGVRVSATKRQFQEDDEPATEVLVPDRTLQSLIARTVAAGHRYLETPITKDTMYWLSTLRAHRTGIADLTGLEAAEQLSLVFLGSNRVVDVTPLGNLTKLRGIDLSDNRIVDVSPLVGNAAFDEGAWINLNGNPLSEDSLNLHVPALLARGVDVTLETVKLATDAGGEIIRFDTNGYFAAILGDDIECAATVSDGSFAEVGMADGVMTVRPGHRGGRVQITVTATDASGDEAILMFAVVVRGIVRVHLIPNASDSMRQGFVRMINRSDASGKVSIAAIDDTGVEFGPASLTIAPEQAVHFNSDDLEGGNTSKSLVDGVGSGNSDWRLRFDSKLDYAVLSYMRTDDGFLTAMHDLVPMVAGRHEVQTFNPGSNTRQVSLLRIANIGDKTADVHIEGIDSIGRSPGVPVSLSIGTGATRTVTAQELESGHGLSGALGDGDGKWRLFVTSDNPIAVASLIKNPSGHLTNVSTVPNNKQRVANGETAHSVPLFVAGGDPRRQGFLRIVNRDVTDAVVRVTARDESEFKFNEITLSVPARGALHFNADDLELGNPAKGVFRGIGEGTGHWQLLLTSSADLDVLTFVRAADGFLTSMHDTVPETPVGHLVPIFNPADNKVQVSSLRIVNPSTSDASVNIAGMDDLGTSPGGTVRLIVPAGKSRTLSAQALEAGNPGFVGRLGNGAGRWRLIVSADQHVRVMNLLESPTGHLTNLSSGAGF